MGLPDSSRAGSEVAGAGAGSEFVLAGAGPRRSFGGPPISNAAFVCDFRGAWAAANCALV
jgi:hypothetical protein